MADALRTDLPGIDRYRRLSGVDVMDPSLGPADRFVRSRWLWTSVVVGLMAIAALVRTYVIMNPDRQVEGGVIPGLNNDALWQAASYALPTLLIWSLVFLLVDRWRPQRLLLWVLVLVWGGSIATYGSLVVNSWAADRLSIDDNGNQLAGARAAIYIAPFVEEFFKGTGLLLVAFLDRQRLTSKLSMLSLAGLSGIGFAFTENIVYYARAIVYGSHTAGTGDVTAAVEQLVYLRGFLTSFGHPLFCAMTGLGLAIGLRSRSKVVRVVGPLAGYLFAALLHMTFNTTASIAGESQQKFLYFLVALPLVFGVAGFALSQVLREGRLIRQRLGDYVRMGWLPASYPEKFAKLRWRVWVLFLSPWWGKPIPTFQLVRAVTTLAYLRDAIARGIVDASGLWRERELLAQIRSLRAAGALDDTTGLKPYLRSRPQPVSYAPPAYPGPSGLGGNWPAPGPATGAPPVGSGAPTYSTVNPTWGPPKP